MEHIVHHHIISHFEELGILNESQHGFRKKRSCESQLILTIHDLAKSLDEGGQIDAILLDFSKAFDKVPHQRLRMKLEYYGVRGETLDWISGFLNGRTQSVVCNGSVSSQCEVESGVPQGTVLGPLLFLVYINDLPDSVCSSTRLFADDCLLYRRITSEQDAKTVQDDLDKLQKWENDWQMSFNPDKCEVLRVTLKRKPTITNYFIHGKCLETVKSAKYLGLNIDSKLTFNNHVDTIAKKANKTRAFIARTTKRCPQQVKAEAYKTYVRPLLEYSASVWDPHTQNSIQQLEAVQRRAARSVLNNHDKTSSVTAMLQELKWEPLQERRAKARVTMCYRIVHALIAIPTQPYLIANVRFTRGHDVKFLVPSTRVAAFSYSFFPATIRLWNSLPLDIVSAPTLDAFRGRLAGCQLTGG